LAELIASFRSAPAAGQLIAVLQMGAFTSSPPCGTLVDQVENTLRGSKAIGPPAKIL
jgi:hypothetical protein